MTIRRWCLGCFEDFAEDFPPNTQFCYACQLEHERAIVLSGMSLNNRRNNTPTDWWGPRWSTHDEINTISNEDLGFGFTVVDESGQPVNMFFDPKGDD